MTDANANNTAWIDAWIETQRDWLGKWQSSTSAQRGDAGQAAMETLRSLLDPQRLAPDSVNLAHSFQQLLLANVQASGEWARQQATQSNTGMSGAPALGPMREYQLAWQALLRAQRNYQQQLQTLLDIYAELFSDSLNRLPAWLEQRATQGHPAQGLRDLHESWIELGESLFAKLAHDPKFVQHQTACTNALSEFKQTQATLIEHWLKSQDLPTRSELNSVHQRLRQLQQRIAELEAQQSTMPKAP